MSQSTSRPEGADRAPLPPQHPASLPGAGVLDTRARPLRSLRVSVTDRCNLRCAYCMPEQEYSWLPRADLLTFEEIARVVDAFADLGVQRVRLTGGEPLLRRDLHRLVAKLTADPRLGDVALTTNGVLLAETAADLRDAGLHRLTVSLDTLRPERFRQLTRNDELARVLRGIEAAAAAGFEGTKLDSVVMRGVNEDELVELLEFGRQHAVEVRFIEYMDVGGATRWSRDDVVSQDEILQVLGAHYGAPTAAASPSSAPAKRFRLPDGLEFGIIASTTKPFCSECDRSRLTADGNWLLCLYAQVGLDLRPLLRGGGDPAELRRVLAAGWAARTDRGAEERSEARERGALVDPKALQADPHLEMHTRGG